MDVIDQAQHQEELHRAAAPERAASMARQALGRHATSANCEDCGGEIEAPRQVYGFPVCAACARDRERAELRRR